MGKLKDYCNKLYGQYNNDIKTITLDSTNRIFDLIKKPNKEIFFTKKLSIGKFYIIRYNYNSNKIWCPIFIIDDIYKPDIQKRIIYAINIDYLPYSYRILFFDILFSSFVDIIEYNNSDNIDEEKSLKVDFNLIYKLLKNNGQYEYSITAFDYLKIDGINKGEPKIFFVSTNFISRFIFIDTKIVNLKNMIDLSLILDDYNMKNKLNYIINLFKEIEKDLDINDQKTYYKKLKLIENKYKLIDNNKF